MFSLSRLLLPRPKHFLGFLDLRVGVELILLCSLFNKASGFYGLLAIFTGAEISALQISMYVYSVLSVLLIAWVQPHIRKQTPFPVISFGYWYVIDSIINGIYTVLFTITWFMIVSESRRSQPITSANDAPGVGNSGKMIEDISGLSGGPFNPDGGPDGTDTPAPTYASIIARSLPVGTFSDGLSQPESMTSVSIIVGLWVIRAYFCLVVLAYARQVVRDSATPSHPPFTGKNGEGLEGMLGRMMVRINRGYWEGPLGWTARQPAPPAQPRKLRRSLDQLNRKKSDVVV